MSETLIERLLECAPAAEAFGRPDMAEAMRASAAEIDRLERDVDRLKREVRDWECWLGGVLV